ncbi:hypothetical protein LINPERHAP1_LOCUS16286 [Linum perenne]
MAAEGGETSDEQRATGYFGVIRGRSLTTAGKVSLFMRTFGSFLTILNPPVKYYCNDIYLITHAGMGRWVLRPLHYDRPDYDAEVRDLTEGVTAARTVCVYINKLSVFQARRRLAQVQLRMFEVVTKRRGVLIEEVMVGGGAGQGEPVVDGGRANNHLLALEYNVDGSPSVLNQATSESPLGPVSIAQADPTTHLNTDAVTRPDPPTPPSSQIPPSLEEDTLPTSRPSSEIPDSPVVDTNNNPASSESPLGTSSSPAGYENNEASDYEYSSEDDSFHADERELGDESSEYEQADYSESEVDEAIDNVLRRRGNPSQTTDEDSDVDGLYDEGELLNETGWGSEEEEREPRRLPRFRPERDLDDPELKLGLMFENLGQFKEFCKANAVKQRRVGVDGNGGMYPIAWAVVESETTDTWDWFIGLLAADLAITNTIDWTWMSDKQKGLMNVLEIKEVRSGKDVIREEEGRRREDRSRLSSCLPATWACFW